MPADHDLGRDIQVRDLVGLGDKRRRPGSAGIGLYNMDLVVLDRELDIDEPFNVQGPGDLFGIIFHGGHDQGSEVEGRQHGMTVTTVDTGRLNMLHDPHHVEILPVEDGVHFRFLTTVKEMIDQDLVAGDMFEQAHDCLFYFFIIDDDPHPLTTQHIAGTHQNGIAYPVGHLYRLVDIEGRSIVGVGDIQLFQHIAKTAAVFRNIHAVKRGSDDLYALFRQLLRQLQRRLTSQLYDHPLRLLMFDDLPEMLPIDGLEIQLIGNIEIGGDRLRIAVDHYSLISAFLYRQ